MKRYYIWDRMDHRIHRGVWFKKDCVRWMKRARKIFPSGNRVDEVWTVRKFKLF